MDIYLKATQWRLARIGVHSTVHEISGVRLHLYEYHGDSDGRDFAVVHGLGSDASAYAPIIRRLVPHARHLLAPELPGHGFSETPSPLPAPAHMFKLIAQCLDSVIQRPVVLIGTSLGGAVAMKYALHSPQNVKRLILVSPAGAPLSDEGLSGLKDLFKMDSLKDARSFLKRLYHRPPWYAPMLAVPIRAALSRPVVQRFLDIAPETDFLKPEDVSKLQMKTLLLWGTSERILPRECLEWYRTHLPNVVHFEEPHHFGHAPHLEVPDALVRRILDFSQGDAQ